MSYFHVRERFTNKIFPWFCDKISTLQSENPSEYSLELLALAHGPSIYATYYTSSIVNGVKFMVHSHEQRLTTQCNGVSTPDEDGNMYCDDIHHNMSSDRALTSNLDDLDHISLSGVGPSMEVEYTPTRSLFKDDDFIDDDDEYDLPHALSSDSDGEDSDSDSVNML
nr:hypothetical protein [Tanacetum cinerariifolium]